MKQHHLLRTLAAVILLLTAAAPGESAIIQVPIDQPTIQDGVNAASDGDTVLIACGSYTEHDIAINSSIAIIGESGDPSCVTVDGELLGPIFVVAAGEHSLIFRGITITAGVGGIHYWDGTGSAALDLADCRFQANSDKAVHFGYGFGFAAANCSFVENSRGVSCSFIQSTCVFESCDFSDNTASSGAACLLDYSAGSFTECSFTGNTSNQGGAVQAMSCQTLQFADCMFSDNTALLAGPNSEGGGFAAWDAGSVSVIGCTFLDNSSEEGGGGFTIWTASEAPLIEGCLFAGNSSPLGSAFSIRFASAVLRNLTVSANHGGPAVAAINGSLNIENTLIAFNEDGSAFEQLGGGSTTLLCSDIYGNAGGDWVGSIADQLGVDGNFTADPLLCDVPNRDFTLESTSPCAAGNHPDGVDCGLIGARPVDCTSTSVISTSWGGLKAQYRD